MQKVGCVRALGSPGHQCTDHPCDVRGDGGNDDNPERTGELVENEGGDQYASPGGNISRVDPFCQTEADDGCLGINPQLESQGDGDISTDRIGELVMEGLKGLDDVAYVRFASVYRNFREARDFNAIVGELEAAPDDPGKGAPKSKKSLAEPR